MQGKGRFRYKPQRTKPGTFVQAPDEIEERSRHDLNVKLGIGLSAVGVVLLTLFPFVAHILWFKKASALHTCWYAALSITILAIGIVKLSVLITRDYSPAVKKITTNVILLIAAFGWLITWLIMGFQTANNQREVLSDNGETVIGYITDIQENGGSYVASYRFSTNSGLEIRGSLAMDEILFRTYAKYDEIGIKYLPSDPTNHRVFFSDGTGKNISAFPSREFTTEDIFTLGRDFLDDTLGLQKRLRSIDFGFAFCKPEWIDSLTIRITNKHRNQRITISKGRYFEFVDMFSGMATVQSLSQTKEFTKVAIAPAFGDFGYARDNHILTVKNLNESVILFYHFRVYNTNSVKTLSFECAPYAALEEANEFVFGPLH